ncbi:chaplin [Streptomyces sp. Tue6028]|uniref:chaplin n=1 Tax=Streptomyces sp. Tue6028 TaxID=2036037 RepID=UPI003D76075E
MVVAAAATSIVSLYGNPAFADAGAEGVAADSPGIASGNNVQVPLNVPVNACGNTVDVIALLNPAFGNSCANGSGSGGTSGTTETSGTSGVPGVSQHDDDSVHGPDDIGRVTPGTYSGSSAHGETTGSPGVLSGGLFQVPLDVPVNACGNTVDVVSALNPAFGNECGYGDTPPTTPPKTTPPKTTPPTTTPPPTPPPTTTPPRTVTPPSTPPATPPPTYTPPTPPASTPPPVEEQTPPPPGGSLPNTGSEGTLAASAASAALLAGGILLYRRGRAASRR